MGQSATAVSPTSRYALHIVSSPTSDPGNVRIKFESKLRELNGKLDYVNNKLRVVERDFFEAEKAIGSKNIKLSNQDDSWYTMQESGDIVEEGQQLHPLYQIYSNLLVEELPVH